jgi:hypothetical protein
MQAPAGVGSGEKVQRRPIASGVCRDSTGVPTAPPALEKSALDQLSFNEPG